MGRDALNATLPFETLVFFLRLRYNKEKKKCSLFYREFYEFQ